MTEKNTIALNLSRGLTPLTKQDFVKIIRFVQTTDATLLREIVCEDCPEHIRGEYGGN